MRTRTTLALAGLALIAGATLTACDDGPPCEQYVTTWQLQPMVVGKITTFHMVPVSVCVKYAPEPTKSGS